MKYVLDNLEIELLESDKALLYFYGRKNGRTYNVSLQKKGWLDRSIGKLEIVDDLPNIVFTDGYSSIKLIFFKKENQLVKFRMSSRILFLWGILETQNYANFHTVSSLISDIDKSTC